MHPASVVPVPNETVAPLIAIGANRDVQNVVMAIRVTRSLRGAKRCHPNEIDETAIATSEVRQFQVLADHVSILMHSSLFSCSF